MRTTMLGMILVAISSSNLASAAGWEQVHRYVKPSGMCGSAVEVLASHYALRGKTATGAMFDPGGNTAAGRSWPMGTILRVSNPWTGQSVTIIINDRGPFGTAYEVGARLDLALGAAQRIGMRSAQYVCVSVPDDIGPEIEAKAEPVGAPASSESDQ